MNQTQKGAWFSLAMGLFCVALYIWLFIQLFVVRSMPESHFFMWPLLVMVLLTGVGIIAIRKKQSPQEIEKDERDKLIEKRAVIAAFISVWILLFAATMIPICMHGSLEELTPFRFFY